MMKAIYSILILLITLTIEGQNINLIKNTHPKARELKHTLNTTRDSLILDSEKTILQVEIFNEDYENLSAVEDNGVRISLKDLPVGKFVVEAKLTDRIIVMDLIKYSNTNNLALNKDEDVGGIGMMLDEQLNLVKTAPNNSIEFILTRHKPNRKTAKEKKYYWTVMRVNNGMTTNKTMRLADQKTVDEMILKHKLELKTSIGRRNELLILEIYDKSKFIESQVANPNYINSYTSEYFNVTPYYSSQNNIE